LKTSTIRVLLIQFAVHSGALQGLQPSSASRSVNNNVVLSSFGGRGSAAAAAGRLTARGEAVSAETTATEPATAPAGRATDAAADLTAVVAPSAVVSGGMMTLPTAQRHVSVNGAGVGTRVSPWQRGPAPTGPGRRLTGGGGGTCSYGVSSPCCKLVAAAATVASPSSSSTSSCQLRSVTLPRGHPATYSGEVAARLRPPPPPSAAAIRQAAVQRAAAGGLAPTGKTWDARRKSPDGRGAGGFKSGSDAGSNTEQRRSISTVIV